jgi:hypothetical protein
MLIIVTNIIFFITFILTFVLSGKIELNKKVKELKSISFIFEIGAFFDIMIFILNKYHNAKLLGFLYSIIFPICILFEHKLSALKNYFLITFILIVVVLFYWQFNVVFIKKNFSFFFYIFLPIQITAISISVYKTLQYKIKLSARNYFYHLIVGLLVLDLFYFLGYYRVIDFEISVWMQFLTFYLIYLNIMRVSYITYVAKNL